MPDKISTTSVYGLLISNRSDYKIIKYSIFILALVNKSRCIKLIIIYYISKMCIINRFYNFNE